MTLSWLDISTNHKKMPKFQGQQKWRPYQQHYIVIDIYEHNHGSLWHKNMLFYGGITKPRKSGSMGKFELWVLLLRCPEQTLMMRFYWIERQIRWNYLDRDSRHILGETSSCCCGIVVLMIVRLSASLKVSSGAGDYRARIFEYCWDISLEL